MIEAKSLRKEFGPIVAVDGVSLKVELGEVLGFLGPNGAGKSTTMKMITGFLAPTSGTAVVAGHDVVNEPLAVKARVGYLPEGAPAYPDMTTESFLEFVAEVRGLRGSTKRKRTSEVVSRLSLKGVLRQPIETLSKGFKRRVGLAQAIIHDPDVLIMDEPTDGLDPNQKHEVRELIREMASRKAIVLSTHILEEVHAVCNRVTVIARGKVLVDETPAKLESRSRYHNAVSLAVKPLGGTTAAAIDELRQLPGVEAVEENGAIESAAGVSMRCTILPRDGRAIVEEVTSFVRSRGWDVKELRVEAGRLDEVFRTITLGGERTGTTPTGAREGAGELDSKLANKRA
ncbi:MAG: ABC transporter ATP-binding protein [Planctomycetota bacterium]|nr:ABC transporter ATP-binding protein [Planctomycetota bacterium]